MTVIIGIADQQHGAVAVLACRLQAVANQGPADAPALALGRDRERSQQQGRPGVGNLDRPEAEAAGETVPVPGDESQIGQRRHAFAKPIDGTVMARRPEGSGEKTIDGGPVVGPLGQNLEHDANLDDRWKEPLRSPGRENKRSP